MELRIEGIKKRYNRNKVYALDNVSITMTPGVYGLLGPNGAGKSTLMNIMTQNLKADVGYIFWNGENIDKLGNAYRSCLGYMPQQQNLYDEFTGEQFLWYISALKDLKKKVAKERIEELLTIVNLQKERYNKIKTYSGGMKQRLLIAQALLNDPKILIMDEPTAGLDPTERIRIRNFISQISKEKIVLLATHVVSDIEFISKEIIILHNGKIVRYGEPQQLIDEMKNKVFEVLVTEEEKIQYENSQYKIANIMYVDDKICLKILSNTRPNIGEVTQIRASLEDVYLFLVDGNSDGM